MKSSERSTDLDLETGIPTTSEDVQALRRLGRPTLSPEAYLRLLESFHVSYESLRNRRGPRGEPFTLGDEKLERGDDVGKP
ncbi:MAG TPA: hypothetical protein DFS52_22145 [Myxococcales bacterium]|jgi:hypothetical protein|nr:hypothetical protein [Myxococcales bacterium]